MSIPFQPSPPLAPEDLTGRAPTDTSPVVRVLAFVAGLLLLILGGIVSFGSVLGGAVGMGLTTLARHQRRRSLSRWGAWVASTVSVAIVLGIFAFILAEKLPPGAWSRVQHAADSAASASAKAPPPAWIERAFPGTSARAAAQRRMFSPSTQSAFVFATVGVAAAFYVALFGTLGWGAGMLLGLGARGRWPGATTLALRLPD